ncbi:hypothetical protein BDV95DRAFT_499087 [Massariosphaeria phaeospora]|uniref:Tr-type G domain-containing protein n=1 Tax=Massariosphaeria phaeospora TaxID=100035 RepID=A0A7C8MK61_9PLEO|nr:hypothetical protein BDV95DRAFT_499087 [Massariosphaeria phaeospora]
MASIFTFDPDPPRVSSPWATPSEKPSPAIPQDPLLAPSLGGAGPSQRAIIQAGTDLVDYSTITRLEAEPQEGPTEYKLHLLLRRRRSFLRSSTGRHLSGSLRRPEISSSAAISRSLSDSGLPASASPPLSSTQSRQHRLEQLTTQLLWRLQQSCPVHITSSKAAVLPKFPDEASLSTPAVPQRLLPGLEESKGALYEIGVADSGDFVGLAEDEMEESLNNLRAMAASLGCRVDVQRMVSVGECEWLDPTDYSGMEQLVVRTGKLWVAEALVRPEQHLANPYTPKASLEDLTDHATSQGSIQHDHENNTQQLRVSLTGATMSGKSSLLGTLSTATLDNGRGKSRLSLLKHRHEIVTGMTSSVTQELIGYQDIYDTEGTRTGTQVINYGANDVSSWVDIHAAADGDRLVFLSDSAGHPRFRRTTIRGLVGWDPHWTLLCIPADNTEDSSSKEMLGPSVADLDLSQAHLQLCLNLNMPLMVIITKYDLATKAGLRQILSKLLSTLKDAGRKPSIISDPPGLASVLESDLSTASSGDLVSVDSVVRTLEPSPLATVPILLTSSVTGVGIKKLHALLRTLPLPVPSVAPLAAPQTLFYIEDTYTTGLPPSKSAVHSDPSTDRTVVVGGHLGYGSISTGDELILGPYPVDAASDDSDSGSGRPPKSTLPEPTSRSFPGASHKTRNDNTRLRSRSLAGDDHTEWRRVRVVSLRNLRLPVRTLHADQVGTIGLVPLDGATATPALIRIRKGMVLAAGEPKAKRVISVTFDGPNASAVQSLSVGSAVVVYVASVRASSKVVSVAPAAAPAGNHAPRPHHQHLPADEDDDDAFGFGFDDDAAVLTEAVEQAAAPTATVATFQFIGSREFVELDAKVLVLPGGGPGLSGGTERGEKGVAGLEGFVGRVVDGG